MRFLRHKNKWFPDQNGEKVRELNPLLLPIFFAFLGERKRSLPKIKHVGFVRVYTALEKLYDVGYLFDEDPDTLNYTNIIKVLYDESKTLFNGPGIADDLLNSCMACDLDYQLNVVSKAQTDAIMDQLTNKPDMQALYDINEKYFSYYPLMLMELERYAPKTKLQRTLNFSEDDDNEYL
jgi:hypothetical protein